MAVLTTAQYRLATIAAGLGILQGTAWFVMSIICVVLYLNPGLAPAVPIDDSHMDLFQYNLYHLFLNKNLVAANNITDKIVSPDVFTIFMWIYVLSSFLWIVVSVLQIYFINKVNSNPLNVMRSWGVVTCFISFVDLLLVVLIGVDFDTCNSTSQADVQQLCTDINIPVLIIAAKGFILWIINVVFVYVTYKMVRTIQSGKNLLRKLITTDAQIPRATLQGTPDIPVYNRSQSNGSYVNPATLQGIPDAPVYNRSQNTGSYVNPANPWHFNYNPQSSGQESRSPLTNPYYNTPQQRQPLGKY